jgi:hypothetical protein
MTMSTEPVEADLNPFPLSPDFAQRVLREVKVQRARSRRRRALAVGGSSLLLIVFALARGFSPGHPARSVPGEGQLLAESDLTVLAELGDEDRETGPEALFFPNAPTEADLDEDDDLAGTAVDTQ